MTAEEMTREPDALELEELAGMIIAALEGKQSAEVQLPETGENARSRHDDGGEVQLLLRALSGGAQSEAQPGLSAPGAEFLKPLDNAAAETDFSVSVSSAK